MSAIATTALVEEAEKLSQRATPGPWRVGTVHAAEEVFAAYPDGLAGLASERLLLRLNPNFTSEQDTAFIARARTLVPEFAAALRRAEAELDAATTQLAKKFKRIEELERRCTQAESERDELRATVTRLNRRAQTAEAGVRDNVEACKAAGVSMGRTLANAAADMYLRRAEQAEAERDAQHADVLRLTGELDALATKTGDVEWREDAAVAVVKMRGRQIAELTATRDLLTDENARLQKERDAAMARAERAYNYCPHARLVTAVVDQTLGVECSDCNTLLEYCWGDDHCSERLWNQACEQDENGKRCDQDRETHCFLCGEEIETPQEQIARLQERVATLELLRRGGK